jgi:hypothetical protein
LEKRHADLHETRRTGVCKIGMTALKTGIVVLIYNSTTLPVAVHVQPRSPLLFLGDQAPPATHPSVIEAGPIQIEK